MRLNKSYNLHYVTAKDTDRPALTNIHYDGKTLTATNGSALAQVSHNSGDEEDKPCDIPDHMYRTALKQKEPVLIVNTERMDFIVQDKTGTISCPIKVVSYPDTKPVVDKAKEINQAPAFVVGIDANLLSNLASALGAYRGQVVLKFNHIPKRENEGYDGQITVVPLATDGSEIGVIMPLKYN